MRRRTRGTESRGRVWGLAIASAAVLAGAPAARTQTAGGADYRGAWFGIALAGGYARARCEVFCESASGVSVGYSASAGVAVTPRVLLGADVQLATPFCAECDDETPVVGVGAASVRVILASALQATGGRAVRPVARIGWGGYVFGSGDAEGPPGVATGQAVVAGLALDIPLDESRRRFTRIGSLAPFVSYARALTGRMEATDDFAGVFPTRERLRLNMIHIGLAATWY